MILRRIATNYLMQRQVVLVDENDQELGTAEIYQAHQGMGLKHRALSLILWRKKKGKIEILLQKRSIKKPVFRGLWGNTCCTNLRSGDEYLSRAASRVREEMGVIIDERRLENIYRFSYEAEDYTRKGWGENELDTVVLGEYDGPVKINKEEATDYLWVEWEELKRKTKENPVEYAPWLIMIIKDGRVEKEIYERRQDGGR